MAITHTIPSREFKFFLFGAGFTILLFIIFSFFIKSAVFPFASAQSAAIQACANAMTATGQGMHSGSSMQEAMQSQNIACAGLSADELAQASQISQGQHSTTTQSPMHMPTMSSSVQPATQPTVTQPTATQPTVTQPTVIQPTTIQPTTTHPDTTHVETPATQTLPVTDTSIDQSQALKIKELEQKLQDLEVKQKLTEKPSAPEVLETPASEESDIPEPQKKVQKSPLEKALDIVESRTEALYDLADKQDKDSKKKFAKESAAAFKLITNLCRNKKLVVSDTCNVKKWQKSYKKNARNPDLVLDLLDEMVSALKYK